jgi:uncharacterized membrane protein (UPF0136 family)
MTQVRRATPVSNMPVRLAFWINALAALPWLGLVATVLVRRLRDSGAPLGFTSDSPRSLVIGLGLGLLHALAAWLIGRHRWQGAAIGGFLFSLSVARILQASPRGMSPWVVLPLAGMAVCLIALKRLMMAKDASGAALRRAAP